MMHTCTCALTTSTLHTHTTNTSALTPRCSKIPCGQMELSLVRSQIRPNKDHTYDVILRYSDAFCVKRTSFCFEVLKKECMRVCVCSSTNLRKAWRRTVVNRSRPSVPRGNRSRIVLYRWCKERYPTRPRKNQYSNVINKLGRRSRRGAGKTCTAVAATACSNRTRERSKTKKLPLLKKLIQTARSRSACQAI